MSARAEAYRFIVPLTAAALGALALAPWVAAYRPFALGLAILAAGLALFVLYFFRDPERIGPGDEAYILAAADGVVVDVQEMEEPDFALGRMIRIAVFLSVFDVHINRAPSSGSIEKTIYRAGRFLDARHPDASSRNECRGWWLQTPHGAVTVRQIAGLIARRIVAWSKVGGPVVRGERMGMIRFGSRTEVFIPLGCTVLVKPGDRVRGAVTPLARWPQVTPVAGGAYL